MAIATRISSDFPLLPSAPKPRPSPAMTLSLREVGKRSMWGLASVYSMHSLLPVVHVCPQVPQLFGSVWVSTHWLLQQLFGGPHDVPPHPHAPATHVSPAGHTFPHFPQFLESVWVSTHCELQHVCAVAQAVLHDPQ